MMAQTGAGAPWSGGAGPSGPPAALAGPDTPPGAVPPRGPGVVAPFPAPPRERNPRIWISLVVLGVVVLLCVGGGVAGFVGLTVHETNQATAAADDFLTAIEAQHYSAAYHMQCAPARDSQTEQQFQSRLSQPRLVRHQLSPPRALNRGDTPGFAVPADLWYADGGHSQRTIAVVASNASGGALQVCGTA